MQACSTLGSGPGWAALVVLGLAPLTVAAERYTLGEDAVDGRVFLVSIESHVTGSVYPSPGADKAQKLSVDARFAFDERGLGGLGRDAQTLRSVRFYRDARASITVGGQLSNRTIRDEIRLIVASGKTEGLDFFSPSGPLTFGELELLRTAGDSLVARGLLPGSAVELNESWRPADWVLPLWAGIDAVEKSELTCRLVAVEQQLAKVTFAGETTGAVLGAAAKVRIEGTFWYDLTGRNISRIEVLQVEKRDVGTVEVGLDVQARVVIDRKLQSRPQRLTSAELEKLPLEPNEASRLLVFEAPAWNMRFYHDRDWHLLQQNTESAILKVFDKSGGTLLCNIKKLPDAAPGEHVGEEQFKTDIERTLGKKFQQFAQTEKLSLRAGLYVFRVIAVGTEEGRNADKEPTVEPRQWTFFLAANSDGRQVSFVFTVDPRMSEEFKSRDLSIVGGLEFVAPRPGPTPAASGPK